MYNNEGINRFVILNDKVIDLVDVCVPVSAWCDPTSPECINALTSIYKVISVIIESSGARVSVYMHL